MTGEERFWAKVDKRGAEECWEWQAAKHPRGYGRMTPMRFASRLAHRFAYTVAVGPIPAGLNVLHSCDNPPCCNPAHLHLGTQADNLRECRDRGRLGKLGSRSKGRKLTSAQVMEIRASSDKRQVVADRYGIRKRHVRLICNGGAWTHLMAPSAQGEEVE